MSTTRAMEELLPQCRTETLSGNIPSENNRKRPHITVGSGAGYYKQMTHGEGSTQKYLQNGETHEKQIVSEESQDSKEIVTKQEMNYFGEVAVNGHEVESNAEEVIKQCIFVTEIGGISTDVIYKAYSGHYFVVAHQAGGVASAGRITINQFPQEDDPDGGDFCFSDVRECEGFRNAAKIIGLGLAVDKPLVLYLCLTSYQNEMINNFVQELLRYL
ncbi:hypothetical protein ILUMI_10100 [Ignelater luminosus]|uniref:Uncharacterized protein n=1 Tax=Ignelater luminosus TaxID=2038154 RepID=A0A8K0D126_IGNLU|nr:hypothetical protein ILUMI_10100 [Ignelater luminosus]